MGAHPLTPMVKPSASWKGTLNWARFGTSRIRICSSRSSTRAMDMFSGRMWPSVSSVSTTLVGKSTDWDRSD